MVTVLYNKLTYNTKKDLDFVIHKANVDESQNHKQYFIHYYETGDSNAQPSSHHGVENHPRIVQTGQIFYAITEH